MGRAVLALHYGSEVGVGFLWDGQYWHCTMAVKSVLVSVGRAVLALHYVVDQPTCDFILNMAWFVNSRQPC